MKNLKLIRNILLILFLIPYSCKEENDCEYDIQQTNPCNIPVSDRSGITVGTYLKGSLDGGDAVGSIFLSQNINTEAFFGQNWKLNGTPTVTEMIPSNWTLGEIGVVFGITTDSNDNIYLAASDIYHLNYVDNFYTPNYISTSNTNALKPHGTTAIYKCSPPTYNAVLLTALNTSNYTPGVGIGNLAYDRVNNKLFATNLDDGKIYRIDPNTGVTLSVFDPFMPDASGSALAPQDERIHGIGINYENSRVKIYFPRITSSSRAIYSITLSNLGEFQGSEQLEISNLPGTQTSITDIAFSSNGSIMLVAERGHPHASISFSYRKVSNTWMSYINQYVVGSVGSPLGTNSSGGVDFFNNEICDDYFWNSGNYIVDSNLYKNYGIEGIPVSGNNSTNRLSTDYIIDYIGNNVTFYKGGVGDVEVLDHYECYCTEGN